jgi:hypothetical protein
VVWVPTNGRTSISGYRPEADQVIENQRVPYSGNVLVHLLKQLLPGFSGGMEIISLPFITGAEPPLP